MNEGSRPHYTLADLREVISRLRDPEHGCPWDRVQTHQSLIPNLIEESYEVVEAIQRQDVGNLKEELGDVLLQVALHSEIASEGKDFTLDEVIDGLTRKLLERHPHVFGERSADSPEEAIAVWESVKAASAKAKRASILDDIPEAFPPLLRSEKIGKRCATIQFDWNSPSEVLDKIREEFAELVAAFEGARNKPRQLEDVEEEFGDLLFTLAQFARHLHFSSEAAVIAANRKFEERFRRMEEHSKRPIAELSREELEALWGEIKSGMSSGGPPSK